MANYGISYSCGHKGDVQLYGPHADRERKIAWLATVPCPACKGEADRKAKEAAKAAAAEECAKRGYARLAGTPAQVAWAESIRLRMMDALAKAADKAATYLDVPPGPGERTATPDEQAAMQAIINTYRHYAGLTAAGWWIDHRCEGQGAHEMQREMMLHSPHLTAEVAGKLGLGDAWRAKHEAAAKAKAEAEQTAEKAGRLATKESATAALRAIGFKGKFSVWDGGARGRRIYADDLEYNVTGREAGLWANKTGIADDVLRPMCDRLAAAWKSVTLYA